MSKLTPFWWRRQRPITFSEFKDVWMLGTVAVYCVVGGLSAYNKWFPADYMGLGLVLWLLISLAIIRPVHRTLTRKGK